MKTLLVILTLSLASCAVKLNPDGSKEVIVDADTVAELTKRYVDKLNEELGDK